MTTWTADELTRIARAEELQIAPSRSDGTLRDPVTVWVIRLGDDIYVRSVNGRTGSWFRGVQARHEGHINAGGVDKNVAFADAGHDIDDQVDAAYRAKYRRYAASIVNSIVTPEARAATLKLVPHQAGS